MDTMANMNKAMKYIERNLTDEIDFSEAASIAGCSEYHFRRMFSYISGITLGEYVRRRRLSKAAEILQSDASVRITDLSLMCGYDSPDSFTKAFQLMHGVTPSQIKRDRCDAEVKSFSPMTFRLTIKGGNEMDYRIIKKDAFYIVGVDGRIPLIYEGDNPHTADVWGKLTQADILILMGFTEMQPKGMLNVYYNYLDAKTEGSELNLFVGIATENPSPIPERFDRLPVEASEWVIFTTVGEHPTATQNTWSRIGTEWFPTSGYEMTGGPEILWFDSYDFDKPDFKSEIWIPIRKIKE